jgi:PAS domain S-box-containing protein
VRRVGGIAKDITRRREAEQAIRRSRTRLRSLIEGIPQLVWRAVDHGRWTWASPQWTAFTGQPEEESHGWGWLQPLHPEDRDAAQEAWKRSEETGEFQAEYRLREAATGRYCFFQTRATPVRDEATGDILEWLGTLTDIDELRGLQEHQMLLLAELQHRVRNTLGVVRSVARRTVRLSGSLEECAMHLDGRIEAFARVQAAVTRNPSAGVDLAMLIADELLAVGAQEGEQVEQIQGPKIRLQPEAAETLALVLHELTTNAVKYGALSGRQGRLALAWGFEAVEGQCRLVLHWTEKGVNLAGWTLTRRGFGMELIERAFSYELDGAATLEFTPDGLHCTIRLPATSAVIVNGGLDLQGA